MQNSGLRDFDANRLSNDSVRALYWAQAEAHGRRHNYCGVDDLFYGVASTEESVTSEVLKRAGITHQKIHAFMSTIRGIRSEVIDELIGLTPNAKRALEAAFDAADTLANQNIDCVHILFGLLSEPAIDDLGPVLQNFKADPEFLRNEISRLLASHSYENGRMKLSTLESQSD
ncbi:MAG TPA: Clp protease N-terminal domain-containing protein [Oculatellaceae cyanobacterium]